MGGFGTIVVRFDGYPFALEKMQVNSKQVVILKKRKTYIALLLTFGFISQLSLPVLAQGFDAPSGFPMQPSAIGPGQDTFLPPEVVPQADSGAGMVMGATPGQLMEATPLDTHMNLNPNSGVQSAKDMRKAAFDSILGNTELLNQMPQYDPALGTNFGQSTPFSNQGPGSPGQYAIGQPDWLSPAMSGNNNTLQYGNSSQTQTLTAGSKLPIVRRDTSKRGLGNNIAGVGGLGSALLGTQLRRPNNLFGLGFMGLTMTGFGSRNGFRF